MTAMATKHTLKAYGENAFTFLFFEHVVRHAGIRPLIERLSSFLGETSAAPGIADANADVWLFPCFGKRAGFGEPDALVVVGDHAFWFEVETTFDMSKRTELALRQIYRFHCAAHAFRSGRESNVYAGVKISNDGECRDARLIRANHGAGALLDKLSSIPQHHFVLFSVRAPTLGTSKLFFANAEKSFRKWDAMTSTHHNKPPPFDMACAWYVSWEGNLRDHAAADGIDPMASYVEVKRK